MITLQITWSLFDDYLRKLISSIPMGVYEGTGIIFIIGSIIGTAVIGKKKGIVFSARLFFILYIFLLLCSTVVFREPLNMYKYNYSPFWSYEAIGRGMVTLVPEDIMNVVVFMPVGFITGLVCYRIRFCQVILLGIGISSTIEMLQLVLKRGCSETDDVIHNTLGCLLGFQIFRLLCVIQKRYKCAL